MITHYMYTEYIIYQIHLNSSHLSPAVIKVGLFFILGALYHGDCVVTNTSCIMGSVGSRTFGTSLYGNMKADH